jgi:hypothetical protein
MNPEEILVRTALPEPNTKYLDPQKWERAEIRVSMGPVKKELLDSHRRRR